MTSASHLALVALALAGTAAAADWPQWGGGELRNMASTEKGVPDYFDPGKAKANSEEIDLATTKNVKWVAKLGSQTYGNPVIVGGRVLIGTNNESPRDPAHKGDRGNLMSFDEKTGEFQWQLVVTKLESGKVNYWEFLGLTSSPTVVGNRVYVVTNRCEVLCLDVNGMANGNDGPYTDEGQYLAGVNKPKLTPGPKDADIIWRYDMIDQLGVFPHNASNCSVIVHGGLVYVCTSNGQDWTHVNIPSPNSPSMIALDATTGELRGEDDAGIGPRILHGQWSSPSLAPVLGKPQLFYGGGDGVVYAFDPKPVKDGETDWLKKVWWFDCNPAERKQVKYPGAKGPNEIIATPVLYKDRIYIATGQDPEHGEGLGILHCIDATKTGDRTKAGALWSYPGIARSMSTVAIADGLLVIGDFSGFVHCLDVETGKLHWTHDTKAHIWGSAFYADGKFLIGDESGNLIVFAASKELKIINTINLGAPIYSTPVVANGVLYVGSQTHLYAVQAGK